MPDPQEPPPGLPAPPAPPAPSTSADGFCIRCGRPLRGLPTGLHCPYCGLIVPRVTAPRPIIRVEPGSEAEAVFWLTRRWFLYAFLFVALPMLPPSEGLSCCSVFGLVYVLPVALAMSAVWKGLVLPADALNRRVALIAAWTLRVASALLPLQLLLPLLSMDANTGYFDAFASWWPVAGVLLGLGFAGELVLLDALLDAEGEPRLRRRLGAMMLIAPLAMGAVACGQWLVCTSPRPAIGLFGFGGPEPAKQAVWGTVLTCVGLLPVMVVYLPILTAIRSSFRAALSFAARPVVTWQSAVPPVYPAGTGAAPAPAGQLASDVPCLSCGYNLRGLPISGNCPECHEAVGNSLEATWRLETAPAAYLRSVLLGSTLKVAACAAGVTGVLVAILAPLLEQWAHTSLGVAQTGFVVLGSALAFASALMVTKRPPFLAAWERPSSLPKTVRVFAGLEFGLQLLLLLRGGAAVAWPGPGLLWIGWLIAELMYYEHLCHRAGEKSLSVMFGRLVIAAPLLCLPTILTMSGGPVPFLASSPTGMTLAPSAWGGPDRVVAVLGLCVCFPLVLLLYGRAVLRFRAVVAGMLKHKPAPDDTNAS